MRRISCFGIVLLLFMATLRWSYSLLLVFLFLLFHLHHDELLEFVWDFKVKAEHILLLFVNGLIGAGRGLRPRRVLSICAGDTLKQLHSLLVKYQVWWLRPFCQVFRQLPRCASLGRLLIAFTFTVVCALVFIWIALYVEWFQNLVFKRVEVKVIFVSVFAPLP